MDKSGLKSPVLLSVANHLETSAVTAKPAKESMLRIIKLIRKTPKLYQTLLQELVDKNVVQLTENHFLGIRTGHRIQLDPEVQLQLKEDLEQLILHGQYDDLTLVLTLYLLHAAKLIGQVFAHKPAADCLKLKEQAAVLFHDQGLVEVIGKLLGDDAKKMQEMDELFDVIGDLVDGIADAVNSGVGDGGDGGSSGD